MKNTITTAENGAKSANADTINVHVELTDTCGGEANYSWVRRRQFSIKRDASNASIVRRAKSELGIAGIRCARFDRGDMIELRPRGSCTVAFISFEY